VAAPSSANHPISLRLRPEIVRELPARATRLGLAPSGLLAALVWNDHVRPVPHLAPLPNPERVKREAVTVTLRRPQRVLVERQALARKMSRNAYIEALFAADLREPHAPLVIFPKP
jgi:hypothetical protein